MTHIPNKIEIKILKFLNTLDINNDGQKKYDSEKLKRELSINHLDYRNVLTSGTPFVKDDDGKIWLTPLGDSYINKYAYEKYKECSYWIFGLGSIIAAIYSVLTYYCK